MRLAVALILLTGCTLLTGCARRVRIEGMVLRVDKSQVIIAHKSVPGVMPAMTMPIPVTSPVLLNQIQPGARVEMDLAGGKASRIRKLVSRSEGVDGVTLVVPTEAVAVGQPVPAITLLDQTGRSLRLSEDRGKWIALNFIYTRCPLPEVCPRLTAGFVSVQRRFAKEMGNRLMLWSVTLDPQFDTPAVLAAYAKRSGAKDGWRFLSGDIAPVARAMGLLHWPEEGVIVHTSVTGLIDPEGRLAALVEGSSFPLEQLVELIRYHLDKEDRP